MALVSLSLLSSVSSQHVIAVIGILLFDSQSGYTEQAIVPVFCAFHCDSDRA